ncbi:MAG TPA: hypothetical protein VNN25_03470 [Thermoanaerobaculia bacterium]|nr:hypothetical protein [Thermoanaerobaculia bacterium]
MRSSRVLIATALFFVFIAPSFGTCTFPVTNTGLAGGGIRLSWQPTASATNYEVQVSHDGFQHSTTLANLPAGTTGVTVNELTNSPKPYSYRIIASNPSNATDVSCTGAATILYNTSFSGIYQRVSRIVIPVAGSTRGANNAQFKTSLRLGPPTSESAGKIIFHPAGRGGSDNDPSIPYRVERGQTLQFDDIVAAIGQSGIGSIDVVPGNWFPLSDVGLLPVEARLFNEAAEGTYGAFEAPVMPPDAYRPIDWNIFVPSARFRVNIGIRTITDAHVSFSHFAAGGPVTEKVLDLPADYVFLDAADHFFGVAVNPGDSILISVSGDNVIAIPFHTFTDNSTNDPAVFNPQSPAHVTFPILDIPTATP